MARHPSELKKPAPELGAGAADTVEGVSERVFVVAEDVVALRHEIANLEQELRLLQKKADNPLVAAIDKDLIRRIIDASAINQFARGRIEAQNLRTLVLKLLEAL